MLYTSEITGKSYKTVKELKAAEAEAKAAEKKQEEASEEVKAAYTAFADTTAELAENFVAAFETFIEKVKAYEADFDDEVGIDLTPVFNLVSKIVSTVEEAE